MGITGLHAELGPNERTSLTKLALDHHKTHNRRLRLAIDASIWSFQVQASKGGSNPALRTLYYRLLRLLHHNVAPLFIFDGPARPSFKRGHATNTQLTPALVRLCKKLLKLAGVPFHTAPGEAEAECALLQREGVVDAVLSEDVDTLMFGAGRVVRNWGAADGRAGGAPTHVTVLDAAAIEARVGLNRDGMVLVALMRGGDYLPEGVPGCGIKTAVEAARAGFGAELAQVYQDPSALAAWRDQLQKELTTNASGRFKRRNARIRIPADFPNAEVLGWYAAPAVSSAATVAQLRAAIAWDATPDVAALREYARATFEWRGTAGAAKFVRTLAPVMVARWMYDGSPEAARVVRALHGRRDHASTDGCAELRVSFVPAEIVPIDAEREAEDDAEEAQEQQGVLGDEDTGAGERVGDWSADAVERVWMLEDHVRRTLREMVETWEGAKAKPKAKPMTAKTTKAKTAKAKDNGGMRAGSMDRYLAATSGNVTATPPPPSPPKTRKAREPVKTRPNGRLPFAASKPVAAVVEKPPPSGFRRPLSPPPRRGVAGTRVLSPPSSPEPSRNTAPRRKEQASVPAPTVADPTASLCSQLAAIDILDSSDDEDDMVLRRPASTSTRTSTPTALTPSKPAQPPPRRTTRHRPTATATAAATAAANLDALTSQLAVIDLLSSDDDLPSAESIVTPLKLKTAKPVQGSIQKPTQKPGRVRVALRESLPGAWRVLGDDEEVVEGRMVWEGVEVLDLTGV
ncbi:hypothetical protein EDC01DRAFT_744163 [Geopyxis carbonaria]|nr:hypothetical protein EDC01DRAFT_744163 [Geopyxis carbonaria]